MPEWSNEVSNNSWSTGGDDTNKDKQKKDTVIVVNKEALIENVISAGITGIGSAVATRMLLGD